MDEESQTRPKRRRYPLWIGVGCLALVILGAAVADRAFYRGPIDGAVGNSTSPAAASVSAQGVSYDYALTLLSRLIAAEARGEPYTGMVGVGAVLLNRVNSGSFPPSVPGVVFQPDAFESVSNGLIWQREPTGEEIRAAQEALNGWDPTYGALFFWNPYKPVSGWIWTRTIITQIGTHVFAR